MLGRYLPHTDSAELVKAFPPLDGSSALIFGSRSLSSITVIDTSLDPSLSHHPLSRVTPSWTRDVTSRAMVIPGDINNDSHRDLIVCYPLSSSCSLFFGNYQDNLDNLKSGGTLYGPSSSFFGFSVDRAFDVNEDGCDDLIVCALTGRACFVLYGKYAWPRETRVRELRSGVDGFDLIADSSTTLTGLSVAGTKDMNGDGKPDLAVSVQRGVLFLIYLIWGQGTEGRDVLLNEVGDGLKGVRVIGEQGYYTGLSIGGGGDVNNDGYSDLMIGAVPYPGKETLSLLKSYVIFGSNSSISNILLQENNKGGDRVLVLLGGFIGSLSEDFNDDGIEDIMISDTEDYLTKGNTYIIAYPSHISSPPSFDPTSLPSSIPSTQPSNQPTSLLSPTSFVSFPPNSSPDTISALLTGRPSKTPTSKPTSAAPSVIPTVTKTRFPSSRLFSIQTQNPITLRPSLTPRPSERYSSNPISTITSLAPSPSLFPSSLAYAVSDYRIVLVNRTRSIVNGVEEANERFEISSMSSDGMRRSGWSGTIIGGKGRKIYVFYPKDPSQPVNRIVLQDFASDHVIDLSHFSQITSKADITYITHPLTLFLNDNQKVVLPGYKSMDLKENNFIFASSQTSDSSKALVVDASFITSFILLLVLSLVAVCFAVLKDRDDGKEKKDDYEELVDVEQAKNTDKQSKEFVQSENVAAVELVVETNVPERQDDQSVDIVEQNSSLSSVKSSELSFDDMSEISDFSDT